jgi:hypothetical protein
MTLVEFLYARLDEDEQMKWLSGPGSKWHVAEQSDCECCDIIRDAADSLVCTPDDRYSDHIARFDPHRIQQDLEAKRRIIKEHHDDGYGNCLGCGMNANEEMCNGIDDCPTLCALALPYADHPDYREEWRP